jgi:ribonuclease HIII
MAAGVCTKASTLEELIQIVKDSKTVSDDQILAFYQDHAGSVERTLLAIDANDPNHLRSASKN